MKKMKYKVLAADDEYWSRENLRSLISWEDYSIEFLDPACDGEEVLERIEEEKPDKASGFVSCLKLLGSPFILLCFLGIMCHVGIDVGTNTTAPKILMERLGMTLDEAGFEIGRAHV